MQDRGFRSVYSPETHFEIVRSTTPVTEDGYKINEPKFLRCSSCGAKVLLTEEPSPGIDELQHDRDCDQRFTRTDSWRERFLRGRRSTTETKPLSRGDATVEAASD